MMRREPPPPRPVRGSVGLRVGRTRADPDEIVVATQVVVPPSSEEGSGGGSGRFDPRRIAPMLLERDGLVLLLLLALAAVLRLPGLEGRGIFDADQGRDMLVIYNLVERGMFPLLGPETISIPGSHLHHGAFYWYLFAPAAWLSGGSPFAVVLEGALIGIAAVGATWWAGKVMGGRAVGAIAGLLMAISPAAVEQSIFLWNPNPIPLFAALALGGAWQGHRTGRARWYALAIGSAAAVFQLHLLGAIFVIPILVLIAYDLTRALRRDRVRVRGLLVGAAIGAIITFVLFIPLLVNELQTDFHETRGILQFLTHGGSTPTVGGLDPFESVVLVVFRVVGWPLVGQIIDVPVAASIAVSLFLALVIWWIVRSRGGERVLAAWLGGTVVFCSVALAVMAPWLKFVTPGFPTDHYHAFLNPVVVIALAMAGVAFTRGDVRALAPGKAIATGAVPGRRVDAAARTVLAIALLAEVLVAAGRWPGPSNVATWPEARDLGAQIVQVAAGRPIALFGIPLYKSPDSIGFPIVYLGGNVVDDSASAEVLVINCDQRFRQFTGADCGGPAEDQVAENVAAGEGRQAKAILRLTESSAMSISVYEVGSRS
jgi:4-amino-4-deoxy-L-arabinose transferase-like glycosyltransferase